MTTLETPPDAATPSEVSLHAQREGAAKDIMTSLGVDITGVGPNGERENYTQTAQRLAPFIRTSFTGDPAQLQLAGLKSKEAEQPVEPLTSFPRLIGRKIVSTRALLLSK